MPARQRFYARIKWLWPLALGVVSATGFAPLALWPIALLALALWSMHIGQAENWRQAFGCGWLFGLGHFVLGLNWIAKAFTFQAEMPPWLGWVAIVLLSLYLAVFPGLAALGAWAASRWGRAPKRRSVVLVLYLSAFWIVTEWARSWAFTGFAWNPLSAIALEFHAFDLSRWIGTYGVSGLVMLLAGTLGLLARKNQRRAGFSLLFAVVFIGAIGWAAALSTQPIARANAPLVTIVQPNLGQEELNDPLKYAEQFQRIARLSRPLRRGSGKNRIVVWPESAIPDYLEEGYPPVYYQSTTFRASPAMAKGRIASIIGPRSTLLTGTVDVEFRDRRAIGARNSVSALDDQGRIIGSYDKAHLVPYGEYLPMRPILSAIGLSRLVAGELDFWPGPGPRTLDLGPAGKAGVQICYEIVFSGEVVHSEDRPDFIFNPSNDGWFGAWGPPQHLAQARMRAIEEGLPVLRATTTGISALIDADGELLETLGRGQAARIDAELPAARRATVFARYGNSVPLLLSALIFISAIALAGRRR